LKISKFKIFICIGLTAILGYILLPRLGVKLNPSTILPSVTVNYNWSNASPNSIEKDVTSILEAGFSTIKGLKKLNSKSAQGSGYISLEFDKHTDIDIARFEIATLIRQLYKQLPKQTSYPTITINRPSDEQVRAFLSYSINANVSPFKIQNFVKTQIEPKIGAIAGVDKTEVYGANSKEYILTYKSLMLNTLEIDKQLIINTLDNHFKKEALGNVSFGNKDIGLTIKSKTLLNWHIPVAKKGQKIVYLDELVTIQKKEQEAQSYYRINGDNAVTFNIYAAKRINTITLSKTVANVISNLKEKFPNGYTIVKTYDSTDYLKEELDKIYERSLYTVLILFLFILIISRSFKYLLVTFISIVANLGIAFLLYYAFNIEIQLYSLAGITISLGLIIDNSIVMIDHIRHQNNKQVFTPILSATLTTMGALFIIYFLDDKYKVNLIDFALVIIINLGVSLLIAQILIPALLDKITLLPKKEKPITKQLKQRFYRLYNTVIAFELRFKKLIIIFIILVFGIPFFMLPQKLEHNNAWYEKAYNSTLGNGWYKEDVRPYLDRYLGGSFRLFNRYVFENATYTQNEETKLYVTAEMEKGATVHQMNSVFLGLENYLSHYKEIKQYTCQIYSGDYGRMEITFKDADGSFPFILKSHLIRKVLDFGGIEWNVIGLGNGFNSGGNTNDPINFSVKATGYNYDELNTWADTLKASLQENLRIRKVLVRENSFWAKKPSYQYKFLLNKELLTLAEVSPLTLINELKETTLSKYSDVAFNIDGKSIPFRFESQQSKSFDIWHVNNSPVDSLNKPLLLKNIAQISKENQEENIYKENQEYIRLVEFQYNGAKRFGSKFLDKKLKELVPKLPVGYAFERSEKQWSINNDKNNNYPFLLLVVACIIYCICSILFESFTQPFIILSVIPISFIGVFLTFYFFNFNFDQGGLASFVLLSGITVNASIFILNDFNKLKKEFPNQDKIRLYLQAFQQKIFPILLTVISTILGFIPFVKDGQGEVFWFALGVGTIGGLIFSMIGILFYLPIFTLKKHQHGV